MDTLQMLQQIYDAYEEASILGDEEEMNRLKLLADKFEQTVVVPPKQAEAQLRIEDYQTIPPVQRGAIGTGQAFSDAGRAIQQNAAWMTGNESDLARLTDEQQVADSMMSAAGNDNWNLGGNMLGYGAMALPGALGAGMATAGMGLPAQMAAQGAVAGLELPATIPGTNPETFGAERAQLAGMGMLAGAGAEGMIGAIPAAARAGRSMVPDDVAPVAPAVAQAELSSGRAGALADEGIELLPGQRNFIETGDVSGLSAIEAARKLQGSNLQRDVSLFDETQGQQVAGALERRAGDYTETGAEVGAKLGSEATARQEAADSAWSYFREGFKDEVVLDPAQRTGLLTQLREVLVNEDPNVLSNPARALDEYLETQLAMDGRNTYYTAQGLDGLRRDIRNIRTRFSNPEEQRIVDQVYRAVTENLRTLSGDSPAITALRDAVSASRRAFQLTDTRGSSLSETVQNVLNGRVGPEALLDKLLSGRGDNAVALLRDLEQVMPEAAPVIKEALKKAAISKALGKRLRQVGGNVDLKTPGGYKAVADAILDFVSSNGSTAKALFSQEEIRSLETLALGIGDLAPPRNIPNYSNTAGAADFLRRKTRDVPFVTGWLDDAAEGRLRGEVFDGSDPLRANAASVQRQAMMVVRRMLDRVGAMDTTGGGIPAAHTGALAGALEE